MSRLTASEEHMAQLRRSRDASGWRSAKALLDGDMNAAKEWAAMAAEDDQQMTSLRHEMRTARQAQA
ncbi:MAG: hypothetical protein L0G87_01305 [Renibacterium salmoninarum]|nr:hypothetical protein [Renibacterium salmoninarum]